ncbi:MAG: hypothetical protein ACK5YB_14650 [Burkholderiales bacterium]|jgi:hypothetical protein
MLDVIVTAIEAARKKSAQGEHGGLLKAGVLLVGFVVLVLIVLVLAFKS